MNRKVHDIVGGLTLGELKIEYGPINFDSHSKDEDGAMLNVRGCVVNCRIMDGNRERFNWGTDYRTRKVIKFTNFWGSR